jgi:hypothetical protein
MVTQTPINPITKIMRSIDCDRSFGIWRIKFISNNECLLPDVSVM